VFYLEFFDNKQEYIEACQMHWKIHYAGGFPIAQIWDNKQLIIKRLTSSKYGI
jgi:hypothetical protein